jgi:hypothetical protein
VLTDKPEVSSTIHGALPLAYRAIFISSHVLQIRIDSSHFGAQLSNRNYPDRNSSRPKMVMEAAAAISDRGKCR